RGAVAPDGAAGRAQDGCVHYAFDRRGDPPGRPDRGDERAARPHQGNSRCAVRPPARCRSHARRSALRAVAGSPLASVACGEATACERPEGGGMPALDRTGALPERDLTDDRARAARAASARRLRRMALNLAIRLVSLAAFLVLWEIVGSGIDPVLFTTPTAV